jgi:hypothetical protein
MWSVVASVALCLPAQPAGLTEDEEVRVRWAAIHRHAVLWRRAKTQEEIDAHFHQILLGIRRLIQIRPHTPLGRFFRVGLCS